MVEHAVDEPPDPVLPRICHAEAELGPVSNQPADGAQPTRVLPCQAPRS